MAQNTESFTGLRPNRITNRGLSPRTTTYSRPSPPITPTGTPTPRSPVCTPTPAGRATSAGRTPSNSGNQISLLLESNKRIEETLKEIQANHVDRTPAKHRERVPKELSVC